MSLYYESLIGLSVTSDICLGNSSFKSLKVISILHLLHHVAVRVQNLLVTLKIGKELILVEFIAFLQLKKSLPYSF